MRGPTSIDTLPVEINTEIFIYVIADAYDKPKYIAPIQLSHVNRRWRAILSNFPSLWAIQPIFILEPYDCDINAQSLHNLSNYLDHMFRMTGQKKIHVELIYCHINTAAFFESILEPHFWRISKFSVYTMGDEVGMWLLAAKWSAMNTSGGKIKLGAVDIRHKLNPYKGALDPWDHLRFAPLLRMRKPEGNALPPAVFEQRGGRDIQSLDALRDEDPRLVGYRFMQECPPAALIRNGITRLRLDFTYRLEATQIDWAILLWNALDETKDSLTYLSLEGMNQTMNTLGEGYEADTVLPITFPNLHTLLLDFGSEIGYLSWALQLVKAPQLEVLTLRNDPSDNDKSFDPLDLSDEEEHDVEKVYSCIQEMTGLEELYLHGLLYPANSSVLKRCFANLLNLKIIHFIEHLINTNTSSLRIMLQDIIKEWSRDITSGCSNERRGYFPKLNEIIFTHAPLGDVFVKFVDAGFHKLGPKLACVGMTKGVLECAEEKGCENPEKSLGEAVKYEVKVEETPDGEDPTSLRYMIDEFYFFSRKLGYGD